MTAYPLVSRPSRTRVGRFGSAPMSISLTASPLFRVATASDNVTLSGGHKPSPATPAAAHQTLKSARITHGAAMIHVKRRSKRGAFSTYSTQYRSAHRGMNEGLVVRRSIRSEEH